jgi:hypothetical protein
MPVLRMLCVARGQQDSPGRRAGCMAAAIFCQEMPIRRKRQNAAPAWGLDAATRWSIRNFRHRWGLGRRGGSGGAEGGVDRGGPTGRFPGRRPRRKVVVRRKLLLYPAAAVSRCRIAAGCCSEPAILPEQQSSPHNQKSRPAAGILVRGPVEAQLIPVGRSYGIASLGPAGPGAGGGVRTESYHIATHHVASSTVGARSASVVAPGAPEPVRAFPATRN